MLGTIVYFIIIILIVREVLIKKGAIKGHKQTESKTPETKSKPSINSYGTVSGSSHAPMGNKTAGKVAKKEEKAQKLPDGSTTEYLRQKALEDEAEHRREAQKEAMRLHRETGGRKAAERLYEGDSVPKGMKVVKCDYCGAENLVPAYADTKEYTCYFCREIL